MGTRRALVALGGLLVLAGLLFLLLGEHRGPESDRGSPNPEDSGPEDSGRDDAGLVDPPDPVLRGAGGAAGADPDHGVRLPRPTLPVEVADGTVLVGRVVDDRRRPVANARVATRGFAAEHVAATDARGHFRLAVGRVASPAPAVVLLAIDAEGRTGRRLAGSYADTVGEHDVGAIAVGATARLVVVVHSPEGQPVAEAHVGLFHDVLTSPVLVQEVSTDAEGEASFPRLASGPWRVVAYATGVGRGHVHVRLETASHERVVVPLSPACPFEIHVVDRDTEAPIPDARITIQEYAPTPAGYHTFAPFWPPPTIPLTDAEGVSRVEGLSAGDRLYLFAEAEGYPLGEPKHRSAWGQTASLGTFEIVLARTRTARFPIGEGDGPPPPDGTALVLHADASAWDAYLPPSGRIEDGHIVVEGATSSHVHGVAEAPDGRLARLFCPQGEAVGHATEFIQPRHIDVVVTEADGSPATGFFVLAMGPGNNRQGGPTALDAEGKARLGPFDRSRMNVFLSRSGRTHSGTSIGVIDVDQGSGRIEHMLGKARRVRLEVTVDGERRLPPEYTLSLGEHGGFNVVEDPEAAVLEGTLYPSEAPRSRQVYLASPGYLPFLGEVPGGEGDVLLQADLRSGTWLDVRVMRPSDGRYDLNLQRWEGDDWQPLHQRVSMRGDGRPPPSEWLHHLGPLEPGRYRIVDGKTGAWTEEVALPVGPGRVDLRFDLSRAGVVSGRVEVPAGASVTDARLYVLAPGEQVTGARQGERVRQDGTFRVRVPGTRDLRLVVRHAMLVADAESRDVTVREPTEGVVLRLVPGPTAVFRLTRRDAGGTAPGAPARISPGVVLYARGFEGEPVGRFAAVADGDGWRFGGFEPGTYAVLIDCSAWTPVALPEVTLVDGETDLGAPLLDRGSALRVRVLAPEGQDPPRIFVRVVHQGAPAYSRFVHSMGEAEVIVPGLGAGRFDVTLSLQYFGHPGGDPQETKIEVDGRNDVTLDFDLRK